MTIDWMKRCLALLTIGLFMGVLGACDQQSSTGQTGETTSDAGTTGTDESASGTETTN